MNNDNNFQPQPTPPTEPNFNQPSAPGSMSEPAQVVPPVTTSSSFGAPTVPVAQPAPTPALNFASVDMPPAQPQAPVQPMVQPAAKPTNKGVPMWLWITLGVVVVLVGGAIAAILLIK